MRTISTKPDIAVRVRISMTLLFNLLWFVFGGGILAAIGWLFTGCLLALTIVGIPFSFAAFRIAGFAAFPFGRRLVDARDVGEDTVFGTGLANVLWIIFAGVWLWIAHVLAGIALCVTIIGIPFGLAHFKLAHVCFAPLGRRVVDND